MYITISKTDRQPRFNGWERALRAGALGWPWGMGWGRKWEGGSEWRTHVHLWLIHVNVWQKPLQYCKVISLQLKKKKKSPYNQSYGFSSSHVQIWTSKNWCFWTVVLKKTLESPLVWKEIQQVHPKGNQSWLFITRTDVEAESIMLWPPDTKSWLIWKDPDAGKDWRRQKTGTTEDVIVGWHHQLNGHEFK